MLIMANLKYPNERHPVQRHSSLPKHTRLREKEKYEVESPPDEFVLPVQLIVVSNSICESIMEHVLSWLHLSESFSTPSTAIKSQLAEADTNHALRALFACYPSRIVTKGDLSVSLEVLFRTLTDLRTVWNCYRKGQLEPYVNGVHFQNNNDDNTGPGIECTIRIVIKHKHYYSGLSTLFGVPDASKGARNINSHSSPAVKRVSSLHLRPSIPTLFHRHQTNPSQTEGNHVMETSEDVTSHQNLRISGDVVKRLMTPVYTRSKQNTWSSELKVTLNNGSPISKNHSEQEFITTIEGTGEHSDGEKEQKSSDIPLGIDLQRKLSFEDSNHVDSLEFEPKQRLKQDDKDQCVETTFYEHNQEEDNRSESVCETTTNLPINSIISADQGSFKTDVKSETDTRSTYEEPDSEKYNHAASLRAVPQSRITYQMNCDNNNMLDSRIPVFKRTVSLPDGLPFFDSLRLGNRHRSEESLPALKIENENQAWWKVYTESNDEVRLKRGVVSSTSHKCNTQNPMLYCKSNSNILVQTVNLKKNLNLSREIQEGLAKSFPSAYVGEFSSTPNESPTVNLTGSVDMPFYPWPTSLKVRNNETRSMPDLLQPSLEREHHLVNMSANLSVSMQYRPNGEFPDSLNTWSNTETLDSQRNEFYFLPNCPSPICSSSLHTLLQPSEPDKAKNEPPTPSITLSPSTTEQEEIIETIVASQNPLIQCAPPEYKNKYINSSTDLRDPEIIESGDADISPCISIIKLEEEWANINDSPNTQTSPLPNNQRYSSESSSTDKSSNSDPWEKDESIGDSNNLMSPDSSPEHYAKKSDIHEYEYEEEPFRRPQKSPVRPKSLDANYIFKPRSDLKTNISRNNRPEPLDLSNQNKKVLPKFEIQTHDKSPGVIRPKSLDIDRVFSPRHVSNSVTPERHTERTITPVTPGVYEDDLNIPFRRDSNFNLDTLSPRMSLPTIRRKRANQLRKIDDAHRFSLPRNLLRIGTPPADEFEEELPPSMSASLEKLAPEIGDDSCYRIVYELVMTEQSYVSRLFLLNKVFFETIARENEKHRYFSPDVLETIFSNTPQIHSLHKDHLLPLLKKRITEWEKHNKIGDIMRKYAPMFKLYSIYVCEMDDAIEALDKWTSKSSKFNNLLKNIQKKKICGRIGLKEHMLEPVQRLPRYQLLLERYLKKLPDNSEDREDTNKALGIIKEAAQHANDFIKSREMRLRLITIGKMIDGEKIVTPTREIIKEGSISMEGKNGPEQKRLFLFNDMLMVCTPTKKMLSGNENLKVKFKLNVERIKANDYGVDPTGTTFTVRSTTEAGTDSDIIKMQCASEDEKYAWLQGIIETMHQEHYRKESFRIKKTEQKRRARYHSARREWTERSISSDKSSINDSITGASSRRSTASECTDAAHEQTNDESSENKDYPPIFTPESKELREATSEAHERSLSFRRKLEEQKSISTGYHPKQIFRKMQGKSSNDNNGPISHIHLTTSTDDTEIFV